MMINKILKRKDEVRMKLKRIGSSLMLFPLILMGCNQPKFDIEVKSDKFRNTNYCKTIKNIIETKEGNFSFDLAMGEGKGTDYFVIIDYGVDYNASPFSRWFFPGEYLLLKVDNKRDIRLKLSSYASGENLSCSTGMRGMVSALSYDDVIAIINATSISFEIEIYRSNTSVTGQFSQKNLDQLRQFKKRCLGK